MSAPLQPPEQPGSGERDAWLGAALRHAPDADVTPPAALRRSILDEARAAAFANAQAAAQRLPASGSASWPRGERRLGGLLDFWRWLARPGVAAGFASVMAATLVGVMWWDRPLDEALPVAAPPLSAVPAAPQTAARVTEAAPSALAARPEQAEKPAASPAAHRAAKVADAPQPFADAEDAKARAPSARAEQSEAQVDAGREAARLKRADATARNRALAPSTAGALARATEDGGPARPTEDRGPARATEDRGIAQFETAAAPPGQPAPAPTPSAVPPPVPAPAMPTLTPAPTSAPTVPAGATAPAGLSTAPAAKAIAAPPRVRMQSPPDAGLPAAASVSPPAPVRPLANVLGAIDGEPARWSVQRANGEQTVVDAALRAWLASVDATAGWAPTLRARLPADVQADAAAAGRTANAVAAPAATVTLLHDGQPDTVITIGAGRVAVERRAASAQLSSTAALTPQAAAALAASLPAGLR